ncbi:MAG: MFS transporter [Anaerolineae bacterium]|nr:MFS transporter [Anaerolineae bacterium]
MLAEIRQNVRFNLAVNVMDGAFYGLGLGVASYVTVIPLFVATLTDSSVLIGLIAAMHTIGWQLPQLLTANRVARLRRYKPMVVLMTLNERLPFFPLALIALAVPTLGRELALVLTFLFVIWQSMGSGLTGTAWQSMIAKLIPTELRGMFYGLQSSAANLLSSGGALLAGVILSTENDPRSFALCFFIAGISMMLSLGFLNSTREPDAPAAQAVSPTAREFWRSLRDILRRDGNLRLFIVARTLAQVASVGVAFFTVYAVRTFAMSAATAGVMTGIMMLSQVVANPVFGWLGDHYSHRLMYGLGVLVAGMGAAVALFAPSLEWFYLVFTLAGIANAALWTTTMALTVEFGSEAERPYYIGLANTLVAPATLLAPIVGGWLADWLGYGTTFGIAALSGLAALGIVLLIREPRAHPVPLVAAASAEQS